MKDLNKILQDITLITVDIESKYPELYQFLDENPLSIPNSKHIHLDKKIMEDYGKLF
ncbi:hypothetical protein [Frigoriflavimonas asaccharolytica]|uniref:Uncharacterized protein n=1 Tax=Frigoriflavimonas asaccharolytica TaxID=2735899 RepID=A0A8J8KCK4_9FLAO|nr:hypothetical protein [Frigoriflavimonas asaccharolytica]NRS93739.1 hypothetical protein [Frigoriflavimonas asaccharolytica]